MEIVLYQPQIPANTGNIVRTCHVTGSTLTLVKPLGFDTSDRMLKRAGLDYWLGVQVKEIDDLIAYLEATDRNFYFYSSKATKTYSDINYTSDDILIFGAETFGLHPPFVEKWPERFLKIPMKVESRCLNLSNAAAIVIYEAWKQNQFT